MSTRYVQVSCQLDVQHDHSVSMSIHAKSNSSNLVSNLLLLCNVECIPEFDVARLLIYMTHIYSIVFIIIYNSSSMHSNLDDLNGTTK